MHDVERLLDVDSMLDALGKALVVFSSGITSVPPRAGARVGDRGILGAMPGYVPGIALEVKLVSVFPGNHHHGLASHQGFGVFGHLVEPHLKGTANPSAINISPTSLPPALSVPHDRP